MLENQHLLKGYPPKKCGKNVKKCENVISYLTLQINVVSQYSDIQHMMIVNKVLFI